MASGDSVLEIHAVMPPNTLAATFSTMLGAATPTENFPIWVYGKDTSLYMDFHCRLAENYDGGGVTVQIIWSAVGVTTNEVRWAAAIRRVGDDIEDLDTTAHSYAYNVVDATAPGTIGEVSYDTIAFTSGADMDSLAAGEMFVLRIQRDADASEDNLDDDVQLHRISMIET